MQLSQSDINRFWSKVKIASPDECWEWGGYIGPPGGYGRLQVNHVPLYAHRIAYVLAYNEIPSGGIVCHSCDNPKCVNPAHLWIGTQADNVADRVRKGRTARQYGESAGNAKLTRSTVLEIRRKFSEGVRQVQLAREYGISKPHIHSIVHNVKWTWLEQENE